MKCNPVHEQTIRAMHAKGVLYKDIAAEIGMSTSFVRNYCSSNNLRRQEKWTSEQVQLLRDWYADHAGKSLNIEPLLETLGKSVMVVRLKASRLGLTERGRDYGGLTDRRKYATDDERRSVLSAGAKLRIATNGHPRGFAGHTHRPDSIEKMTTATANWRASLSQQERSEVGRRAAMTRLDRYGSAGPANVTNPYSRTQKGYIEDIPGIHFRSLWECNYARYLDWLKDQGEIVEWAYEETTFIFHGVTRAPINYTPDFRITERDGSVVYHEVKGWMDGPSKSKLKRMKKHYPDVKIIVVGDSEYKALSKWAGLIPHWGESPKEREKSPRCNR